MKFKQVIHKRCKGEIVLVSDDNTYLRLLCKKCKTLWHQDGIKMRMAGDMRPISSKEAIEV